MRSITTSLLVLLAVVVFLGRAVAQKPDPYAPPPPPVMVTQGPPLEPLPPPTPSSIPPGPPLEAPPPSFLGPEAFPIPDAPCACPRWKLLAGAGVDLVGAYQENNRAFTVFINQGQGNTQTTGFGDPYTLASRFWLGFAGPGGWGFRTSLWHFDQDQHLSTALDGAAPNGSVAFSAYPLGVGVQTGTALLAPANADVLDATQRLNVNVLDFDVTREIEVGRTFLLLSAGGRFARISQQYNVDVSNTDNDFTTNAQTNQLRSGQRFIGGGPTVALQAWYPLGTGGWSLYGSVRGSFLFGDVNQSAFSSTLRAQNGVVTQTSDQSATFCHAAAVPMGELELGIQWSAEWGRFHPFLRTGVEAKTWLNALSGSTVQNFSNFPALDSSNLNSNLSFFGVTFQAGVNY